MQKKQIKQEARRKVTRWGMVGGGMVAGQRVRPKRGRRALWCTPGRACTRILA